MSERRWITPRECALYLAIHLKTVYAKIAKGEIPAAKIGGTLRVDRVRLDKFMESSEKVSIERKIDDWSM